MRYLIVVLVISISLLGCSSSIKREENVVVGTIRLSKNSPVSAVSIVLTEEAKKKAAENLKFDPNRLLDYVHRALEANALIDKVSETSLPKLEIQVKDMRVRSNFSAIMWGFMAGADSITGDIILKKTDGGELQRFEVSVSYALGGFAGGQDEARMGWLYEKFAEETVNELIGKKSEKIE